MDSTLPNKRPKLEESNDKIGSPLQSFPSEFDNKDSVNDYDFYVPQEPPLDELEETTTFYVTDEFMDEITVSYKEENRCIQMDLNTKLNYSERSGASK